MSQSLTFIDLFCGIGGFHQALDGLGAKCILACDIDEQCRINYELNYGVKPVKDIKDINEKMLPDFDILCGGFPCQPFSNGGKKKTFEDKRGLLFDEIMRIVKEKQPRFLFLENVKHILKVSEGKVLAYIEQQIDQHGYVLQRFQMSPHEYGVPQQRERIYFVCVRKDIYNEMPIKLINEDTSVLTVSDILEHSNSIDNKYYLQGDILNVLEAWDEFIKHVDVGETLSPTILIHDAFKSYTEEQFNGLAAWRKDYMIKNRRILEKYKDFIGPWYTKHKELLSKREIYGKLEWQVGKVKENDSIFNYFMQIRQSGIRVRKENYFPTLVAISQIPIYGREKRYITPRECARLQSFPDTYTIAPNDKVSYKQFGNSVNVKNVKTVIESTLNHYDLGNKDNQ
jgi:DNA (cytosine-5)-methyltransferase 1